MRTQALHFDLPDDRIAQRPAEPRDSARLMVIRRQHHRVEHHRVRDLPDLGVLGPGDLMVVNDTKVLPALIRGIRSGTGGTVKGLYLGIDDRGLWQVMLETRGKLQTGEIIELHDQQAQPVLRLQLETHLQAGNWLARPDRDDDPAQVLATIGSMPLPPYIRKARKHAGLAEVEDADAHRYNTVYADQGGSAAAPTAGLHLTPELLNRLNTVGIRIARVTLHVGLGTFAPVRSERLEDHTLHSERIEVSPSTIAEIERTRAQGKRILAVGTTSVRTLESLPEPLPHDGYRGATDLFIHPDSGFSFRYTDLLMTNFHLPGSTLLALVASLPGVGIDNLLNWYGQAIEDHYRFYSYGDAMLLA
ncbi:MAG: tRNA preQ1(34) S-adenosylmethionine ribosyltransferase-isomerase QueA [Phycisphaeraceae bacterium]